MIDRRRAAGTLLLAILLALAALIAGSIGAWVCSIGQEVQKATPAGR
jgi:hypothetical protein